MAFLHYGSDPVPIEIDDRTMAHLKLVVTTKLRRNESFTLTCTHPHESGERRTALWIQPSIPLRFEYMYAESDPLDKDLLRELAEAANTNAGIVIEQSTQLAPPTELPMRRAA